MSKVFITGDTHGNYDAYKIKEFAKTHQDLTENDVLIICGDFGNVWDGSISEQCYRQWYANQPWTTLFLAGNHENYDMLEKLPWYTYQGNNVQYVMNHLYYLPSNVYNINGYKMLVVGGAESHDKEFRVPQYSWWEQELPTEEQLKYYHQLLEDNNHKFDLVLTHCAPDWVQEYEFRDYPYNRLTTFFEEVSFTVEYKQWFCGHYHTDKDLKITDDKTFHVVYDRIIEI